ncbi:hypothetical protein O3P69_001776 [Scylla paramamosain]|uniref:Uncharacterized protein n=1 Tax=Scylla paramamosain TaxID=85552 RepID=A0AAW0V0F0_SCYPA
MKSLWKFPDLVERLLKDYAPSVIYPTTGFLNVAVHDYILNCDDSTRLDRVLGMLGGVDMASVRSRPFLETREDDEKAPAKISDIIHPVLKEY